MVPSPSRWQPASTTGKPDAARSLSKSAWPSLAAIRQWAAVPGRNLSSSTATATAPAPSRMTGTCCSRAARMAPARAAFSRPPTRRKISSGADLCAAVKRFGARSKARDHIVAVPRPEQQRRHGRNRCLMACRAGAQHQQVGTACRGFHAVCHGGGAVGFVHRCIRGEIRNRNLRCQLEYAQAKPVPVTYPADKRFTRLAGSYKVFHPGNAVTTGADRRFGVRGCKHRHHRPAQARRGAVLPAGKPGRMRCQSAARHRQRNISRGRPATPVAGRHRRQLINQREDVVEGKRRGPVGHEEKGLRAGQVIELFMGMTAGRQRVLLVYSTCPMLQPVRDAVYPQFTMFIDLAFATRG
jgi:hypothetical protein